MLVDLSPVDQGLGMTTGSAGNIHAMSNHDHVTKRDGVQDRQHYKVDSNRGKSTQSCYDIAIIGKEKQLIYPVQTVCNLFRTFIVFT